MDIQSHKFYEDPQATGTEGYRKHFTGLLLTDGVVSMAGKLKCWWAVDAIASYRSKANSFSAFYIIIDGTEADLMIDEDGNYNFKTLQHFDWTDLKENLQLFYQDGVLMLPSEY